MVKFNSADGNQEFFSSGFQGSATYGFHRFYYNGENQELKWVYNYADGTGASLASAGWQPTTGQTYNLAAVHDYAAKSIRIYVDGVLLNETFNQIPARPVTSRAISFFSNVQATVDELALFGTPLAPARIRAQFTASRREDAAANVYYASPTGSLYGRGTEADPLTARDLFDFSLLQPGGIGYFKDGTYTGIHTTKVYGSRVAAYSAAIWRRRADAGIGAELCRFCHRSNEWQRAADANSGANNNPNADTDSDKSLVYLAAFGYQVN